MNPLDYIQKSNAGSKKSVNPVDYVSKDRVQTPSFLTEPNLFTSAPSRSTTPVTPEDDIQKEVDRLTNTTKEQEKNDPSFVSKVATRALRGAKRTWNDVTDTLADTEFFREAGSGLNAIEAGDVKGETFDLLGEEILSRLSFRGIVGAQKQSLEDLESEYEELQKSNLPPKSFVDKLYDIKSNPRQLIPFLAGAQEATEMLDLYEAITTLEENKGVTDEEKRKLLLLNNYVLESQRDRTWGNKVLSVLAHLPSFAGELLATAGIASAVRKGTTESIENTLKKYLTDKGAQKVLENKLARFGIKATTQVGAGLAQTPFASATRIPATAIQNMTPGFELSVDEAGELSGVITNEGDPMATAAFKAYLDSAVEVVSERSGGAFNSIARPVQNRLLKMSMFNVFKKYNSNLTVKAFREGLKKAGWNGVIQEVGEERVGDFGRGVLTELGLSDEGWRIPTAEDLSVELTAFMIPGMAINLTSAGIGKMSSGEINQKQDDLIKEMKQGVQEGVKETNKEEVKKNLKEDFGFDEEGADNFIEFALEDFKVSEDIVNEIESIEQEVVSNKTQEQVETEQPDVVTTAEEIKYSFQDLPENVESFIPKAQEAETVDDFIDILAEDQRSPDLPDTVPSVGSRIRTTLSDAEFNVLEIIGDRLKVQRDGATSPVTIGSNEVVSIISGQSVPIQIETTEKQKALIRSNLEEILGREGFISVEDFFDKANLVKGITEKKKVKKEEEKPSEERIKPEDSFDTEASQSVLKIKNRPAYSRLGIDDKVFHTKNSFGTAFWQIVGMEKPKAYTSRLENKGVEVTENGKTLEETMPGGLEGNYQPARIVATYPSYDGGTVVLKSGDQIEAVNKKYLDNIARILKTREIYMNVGKKVSPIRIGSGDTYAVLMPRNVSIKRDIAKELEGDKKEEVQIFESEAVFPEQAEQKDETKKKAVKKDIFSMTQEEAESLSSEELEKQLSELTEEEFTALAFSTDKNFFSQIFHDRMSEEQRERLYSVYAGYNIDTTNFQGFNDVSTKVIESLKGKNKVARGFVISKLNELKKSQGVRISEENMVMETLDEMPDGKFSVQEFADKMKAKILPLTTIEHDEILDMPGGMSYIDITLPEEERGAVYEYNERVYQSPIKTSAGSIHSRLPQSDSYFAHTRYEDMATGFTEDGVTPADVAETRRILEIQSDLFQKGRLESEINRQESLLRNSQSQRDELQKMLDSKSTDAEFDQLGIASVSNREEAIQQIAFLDREIKKIQEGNEGRQALFEPLQPYRNTWWERITREEVRKAAIDGKKTLLFPTGETAMKIEGLGQDNNWFHFDERLKVEELETGMLIQQGLGNESWIITEVLEDGKFIAAQNFSVTNNESAYRYLRENNLDDDGRFPTLNELDNVLSKEELTGLIDVINEQNITENFDISGKVDTSNPIYKFYEKDVQKFLKKNFNAEDFVDENNVSWVKVNITQDIASQPVIAYKHLPEKLTKAPDVIEIKAKRDEVPFNISQEQGRKWVENIFGNAVDIRFTESKKEDGGLITWGQFKPSVFWKRPEIKVVTHNGEVSDQVVYHEAFHGWLDVSLTSEQKQELIKNARRNILIRPTSALKYDKDVYTTVDSRVEEWLADDFARYVAHIQRQGKADYVKENESLYERILNWLRSVIRRAVGAQKIYNEILSTHDSNALKEEQENLLSMVVEGGQSLFPDINYSDVLKSVNKNQSVPEADLEDIYSKIKSRFQEYQKDSLVGASKVELRFYEKIAEYLEDKLPSEPTVAFKAAEDEINQYTLKDETKDEWFRRKVQDQNTRLDHLQRQLLEQGATINEDSDVFLSKTLIPRRTGARLKDIKDKLERPFVEGLVADGLTTEEMDRYAHALHAPRRNQMMKERGFEGDNGSGMTDAQAEEIINEFRENGKLEALKKHRDSLRKIQRLAHAVMIENGLLTREELMGWYEVYGLDYVPLSRVLEGQGESGVGTGGIRGINVRGKESRRAKGSARKVLPVTAQIFNQYRRAIIRSEKNRVAKTLYNLIVNNNENGQMNGLFRVHKEQYVPQYDSDGELLFMNPRWVSDPNTIGLKIDGKQRYIEIKDPLIARAMKDSGLQNSIPFLRAQIGFLSSMITRYAPDFIARNFMRDFSEGMINLQEIKFEDLAEDKRSGLSRSVASKVPTMLKELFKYERGKSTEKKELFDRFKKAGGEVGYFWTITAQEAAADLRKLEKEYKNEGFEKVKKPVKNAGEFIDAINTSVELGVRVSIFDELTQRGMSENKAAAIAGDITVDFNKMGEWGPLLKSLYLFINPAIQGPARLYRGFKRSKAVRKASVAMIAAGFLNGVLSIMLGGDGDDDIPEYMKNTRVVFATPNGKSTTVFFLPYGFNMFWATGRNMAELVMGRRTVAETVRDSVFASIDAFNPLGGSRFSFTSLVPTAAKPFAEIEFNENWFGAPIMPDQPPYSPKIPDSQRYWSSVSNTSKWIAQTLNKLTGGSSERSGLIDVSPETLDHFVQAYGGSVFRLIQRGVDSISVALTDLSELKAENLPFVSDYYRNIDTKRAKQTIVYEMLDESRRHVYNDTLTERYMKAVDKLEATEEIDSSYAEKLRNDFKENQSIAKTGDDTTTFAIRQALEKDQSRVQAYKEAYQNVFGDEKPDTYDETAFKKQFVLHETFGFDNELVARINDARTNEDKAKELVDMKEEMTYQEFRDFFIRGRKTYTTASGNTSHILISDDLLKKYREEERRRSNQK